MKTLQEDEVKVRVVFPKPCAQKRESPDEASLEEKRAPPRNAESSSKLRRRPLDELPTSRKILIASTTVLANFTPMLSFGVGIGSGIHISATFSLSEASSSAAWIAASYPLTAGAFVLAAGRLGAVYGHRRLLSLGGIWWVIFTLANAFCKDSFIVFNIVRGMSGLGSAMVVPNAVAIVGQMFPPGRGRNITLGLFGAAAPAGGWGGAMLAGCFQSGHSWKWIFVTEALIGVVVFGSFLLATPSEDPVCEEEGMDWVGCFLGIGALILFNFVWNQAPSVGWACGYEIALLVISVLLFIAFGLWEHRLAAHPIMPLTIWAGESFLAVIVVVMFSFMSYGTFIWYLVAWQQRLRHWTVLSTSIGLIPLPICSAFAAFLAAWLVPRLAARWILVIGAVTVFVAEILVLSMPEQQNYWMQVFPATVLQSFCPDFIYTAAQIVACNAVKKHEQGIAGSLIGTLQLYATSTGLGFAGIVESRTSANGMLLRRGYQSALIFSAALSAAAGILSVVFVRMPSSTSVHSQDSGSGQRGKSTSCEDIVTTE